MNETSTGPDTAPGPSSESAPPPHQDLDRLRRSTSDRYVAGVAGGIGRHFGIDPTVIRVLLAVLAFFGGAGVLIYAVCWLFVPEDGHERAPIHIGAEPRKLILIAAAAIAFLLAMNDAFNGFNAGWPIATLAAIVVALVLIRRDRRETRRAERATADVPQPYAAASASAGAQTAVADQAVDQSIAEGTVPPAPPLPPAPASWQPPQPPQPPLVPPRRKRTGVVWFWPTLAMIAIALGTLGVVDAGSTQVASWVYPATAVAITGVMLLVGSFYGRPGGLILLGFVSTFALSVATVLGGFHFDGRSMDLAPTSAAVVASSYDVHNGKIVLDLTELTDPTQLAGRTIQVRMQAGRIRVVVPQSVNVDVKASFGFAGSIQLPGYDGGGIQDSVERHLRGITASPTSPELVLDLHASVGQIIVEQL